MSRSVVIACASTWSKSGESGSCTVGLQLLRLKDFLSEDAKWRNMLEKSLRQDAFMGSGTILLKRFFLTCESVRKHNKVGQGYML